MFSYLAFYDFLRFIQLLKDVKEAWLCNLLHKPKSKIFY